MFFLVIVTLPNIVTSYNGDWIIFVGHELVSVEGISETDAEKIMDLRGSSGELLFTTLLLETTITEEQMLQWA